MPGPRGVSVPLHTWMVAYDIVDDTTRQRVAGLLGGYGERVQYSVFECRLNDREMDVLRRRLIALLDLTRDQIRWYPMCHPCHGRVLQQGEGSLPEDEGFYLV